MSTYRPLGVGLTPLETRRDVVLHVATRAEHLGYDAFHLSEGWGYDASVLLAEVAMRTRRIRLGTGVLNVWGRSAASIAMLATTLDEVSGGRFTLGLGAGSPQLAEGLHDVAFDAPVARLGTVLRQVRRLLDGERLTPAEDRGHRPLRLATTPKPALPIHVAALGPARWRWRASWPTAGTRSCCRARRSPAASSSCSTARRAGARADLPVPAGGGLARPGHRPVRRLVVGGVLPDQHGAALPEGAAAARPRRSRRGRGGREPRSRHRRGPVDRRHAARRADRLGVAADARVRLDRWYAAGAQLPVLALPPNRPVEELDHVLESLRPSVARTVGSSAA